MLAAENRISLNLPLRSWIDKALSQPGIKLMPLTPEILIESSVLPPGLHGDPADRMIVATSRINRLYLMTRDVKVLTYSKTGNLKTIAV